MVTSVSMQRKERERAERESLILDEAEALLAGEGYLGLKMDVIAQRIGYAKGTIYQHFASKEDMLMALAASRKQIKANWFMRASTFNGRSRERMAAIGVADRLFRRQSPNHMDVERLLQQHSIWEKTTDHWRQALADSGAGCEIAMKSIIGDAVMQGDLKLDPDEALNLILGVRSLSLGVHQLAGMPNRDEEHVRNDPVERLSGLQHRLLDAFGWQPLSSDWDYTATHKRILKELFPAEAKAYGMKS